MSTMRGFAKRIKAIGEGVADNADSMTRKTVITIASSVSLATPVDTGRARANWRTNIGSPNTSSVEYGAKGEKRKGKKRRASPTANAAVGIAIGEATAQMQGYKGGRDIYISNNLPYIGRLNEGHSKQAKPGFIEKAILAGQRAISKSRLVK